MLRLILEISDYLKPLVAPNHQPQQRTLTQQPQISMQQQNNQVPMPNHQVNMVPQQPNPVTTQQSSLQQQNSHGLDLPFDLGDSANHFDQTKSVSDDQMNSPPQCFICPDTPLFNSERELNEHISTNHIDIKMVNEMKSDPARELDILSGADMDTSFLSGDPESIFDEALNGSLDLKDPVSASGPAGPSTNAPLSNAVLLNKATGRPCEICGFEPKTKNKSRERQDHLAMKHYRERIQNDLSTVKNFVCPLCEYVGKDKQTIYRHYTGSTR